MDVQLLGTDLAPATLQVTPQEAVVQLRRSLRPRGQSLRAQEAGGWGALLAGEKEEEE